MNLEKKVLQREATIYMIGTMAYYGHALAKKALEITPLSKGKCFTIIPSDVPESHIYKFMTGGMYPENRQRRTVVPVRNNSTSIIRSVIKAFFNVSEKHCAVTEDVSSRSSDVGIQETSRPYLVLGEEVYDFSSNQEDTDEIMMSLKQSDASYYSFFALLSLDISEQQRFSHPRYNIGKEDVALLASSIQGIIQFAYDGESYLLWDRDGMLLELAKELSL